MDFDSLYYYVIGAPLDLVQVLWATNPLILVGYAAIVSVLCFQILRRLFKKKDPAKIRLKLKAVEVSPELSYGGEVQHKEYVEHKAVKCVKIAKNLYPNESNEFLYNTTMDLMTLPDEVILGTLRKQRYVGEHVYFNEAALRRLDIETDIGIETGIETRREGLLRGRTFHCVAMKILA